MLLPLALSAFHAAAALKVGPGAVLGNRSPPIMAFHEYTRAHERAYRPGSPEYEQRREIYEQRVAEVQLQNSQPDRLWTAGINHLTDRTDEELERLRGYRHNARPEASVSGPAQLGLLSTSARSVNLDNLPSDFAWRHLQANRDIMDQLSCGACWAVAVSTVIRAHAELHASVDKTCSVEQIVACTPNPHHCGGDGGCKGATAELAMEYVMENGCSSTSQWPYSGQDQACPPRLSALQKTTDEVWRSPQQATVRSMQNGGGASFGLMGYQKLPENQLAPLMMALYETGPVAVSVAAGAGWTLYSHGIMNACRKNVVINHAVVLLGFGTNNARRKEQDYWLIQNSWGPAWGESGTIRLQRHSHEHEAQYCGWDTSPEQGSSCAGGPGKVWVCGSCGILYDTVVPTFRQSNTVMLTQLRDRELMSLNGTSRADGSRRPVL